MRGRRCAPSGRQAAPTRTAAASSSRSRSVTSSASCRCCARAARRSKSWKANWPRAGSASSVGCANSTRVARSMRVLSVVGTRPNLMKTAPVIAALDRRGVEQVLVHTGQHYDAAMSDVFFRDLGIREPDHFLAVGSGTHAEQAAHVMQRLEPILVAEQPDVVLVPGDVNSTLAAAIAAAKAGLPVAHLEAGLRSFDRSMPEELNRVLTDAISDLLFIHSPEARDNLLGEGRPERSIHYVGNTMIDSLAAMRDRIDPAERSGRLVVTLHRPALVDGPLLADA